MTGGYLDDPVLFDFCSRIAMGDALIRASYLAADAHQVAVWDGVKTQGAAGTSVDVNHWKGTGRPTLVVGVGPGDQTPTRSSELSRQIRAVVFGDFAGFSVLSDRQAIIFQESVIGKPR